MNMKKVHCGKVYNHHKKTVIEVSISKTANVRTGSIACFENIGISLQDVVTFTEHVNSARYMFIAENGNLLRVAALIATKPTIKSVSSSLHRSIDKAFRTLDVDKLSIYSNLDIPHSLDSMHTQVKFAKKCLLRLTTFPTHENSDDVCPLTPVLDTE